MPSRRDSNHNLIPLIMKTMMGGYTKDENGVHYAHLQGLTVSAYDMYKVGRGLPDWLVAVSWFTVYIEIKNIEGRGVRYTPSENVFNANNRIVYRMFTNGDDAYEFLKTIAQLVNDLDDLASRELSTSYVRTFFPKADEFKLKNSEEFYNGTQELEQQPNRAQAQTEFADNGGGTPDMVSGSNLPSRRLLVSQIQKSTRTSRGRSHRKVRR